MAALTCILLARIRFGGRQEKKVAEHRLLQHRTRDCRSFELSPTESPLTKVELSMDVISYRMLTSIVAFSEQKHPLSLKNNQNDVKKGRFSKGGLRVVWHNKGVGVSLGCIAEPVQWQRE